jgi:hypothetical protein
MLVGEFGRRSRGGGRTGNHLDGGLCGGHVSRVQRITIGLAMVPAHGV